MPAELYCPASGEPLVPVPGGLSCPRAGIVYPFVDGIPILLPDAADRKRIVEQDWFGSDRLPQPLDFYNHVADQDRFCRLHLEAIRAELGTWLRQGPAEGPVLEIGSGRGALQGVAEDYVALDYSFTALRSYVRPAYQRVCGTAECLPFAAGAFRFIYTVATLEHVPLANRAFEEIHRVLRPGGIAYVAPAWHCIQDNCEGIPVRPCADLTWRQKLRKMTLPLRTASLYKGTMNLPGRAIRRLWWNVCGRRPVRLRYRRLKPDYNRFWMSDSDAVSRLDSHEGCLFFQSRSYEVLHPGPSAVRQLLARHHPVGARKPA